MSELDDLRKAAERQLDAQASRARYFQNYYDGDAGVIAMLDTEERRTFRSFLEESQANFCELVVNAVAERLQVVGFRFDDPAAAEAMWAIWQASQMDADSELVQTDALVMGASFVLVQPDESNGSGVSISPESPLEATVLYEPGNRRVPRAGYKRFKDEVTGKTTEILILPDDSIVTWLPGMGRSAPLIEPNPGAELIEIVPQPRTLKAPRSELEAAIPIQDRINTLLFNRMVAVDYGAFRQVWATGVRIARDVIKTEQGEAVRVVRPFDVGANRLLTSENPDSRFGSFPESTLRGYIDATEQDVNHMAAITQTPPHYVVGSIANLAADAIKAAEAGLVAKVRRRALHVGEGWERVARRSLALVGNPSAADTSAEVIWADFETRSLAQLTDSLVKMRGLGVPLEVLWQRYGATPQEVERWRELAAAESTPVPAAPPAPPEPVRTAT